MGFTVTPWVLRFFLELDVSEFFKMFTGNALAPHSHTSMQTSVRLADLRFFSSDLRIASNCGRFFATHDRPLWCGFPIIETLNPQRQTWKL